MELVSISSAVKISNQRVKPFDGEKRYLATGGLKGRNMLTKMVTYLNKPSRADLLVRPNQLIVARMKDTKKVLLLEEDYNDVIVSTGFLVLQVQDGWNPRFLYHYFSSSYFENQKNKLAIGATQKAINNSGFMKILIPNVSLDKQNRAADLLDKADAILQNRKNSLKLLDEYLRSVFLTMFGDDSELANVTLGSLSVGHKGSMRTGPFGSDLKHSEFIDSGIAVLGIDNAVKNHFAWDKKRYISTEKYEKLKRYTIFPRDVIVTIMGTTGRSAVIPDNIPLAINTKHLAAITFDETKANPYFMCYSLQADPRIMRQIQQRSKGAIMDGLNLTIIKSLEFSAWPIELQNKFEVIYHKVQNLKQDMVMQAKVMDTQFEALAQKAFNGSL